MVKLCEFAHTKCEKTLGKIEINFVALLPDANLSEKNCIC